MLLVTGSIPTHDCIGSILLGTCTVSKQIPFEKNNDIECNAKGQIHDCSNE